MRILMLALPLVACGGSVRMNVLDDWRRFEAAHPVNAEVQKPLSLHVENQQPVGYVVEGSGQVITKALARHIKGAKVQLGGVPQNKQDLTVTVQTRFTDHTEVCLKARAADGAELTSCAASPVFSLSGHLGWMLPLGIVTGVLPALFWMGPAKRAIERGHHERGFSVAIDAAAARMAVQLAAISEKLAPAPVVAAVQSAPATRRAKLTFKR